MPSASSGSPNGVKLKKLKPCAPCRISSAFTTRLGAVATSVSMPLISAAKLSGIISRPGDMSRFCAMRSTTGMKMATTAVELIREPRPPTAAISRNEQTVLAAAGRSIEPVAEPSRDAGPHEAFADDEERGDQDDRGIGKPRQRFVHGDDAGEGHRDHHEQRNGVHARPVDDEHRDRGREHEQDEGEIEVHHTLSIGGGT